MLQCAILARGHFIVNEETKNGKDGIDLYKRVCFCVLNEHDKWNRIWEWKELSVCMSKNVSDWVFGKILNFIDSFKASEMHKVMHLYRPINVIIPLWLFVLVRQTFIYQLVSVFWVFIKGENSTKQNKNNNEMAYMMGKSNIRGQFDIIFSLSSGSHESWTIFVPRLAS